MTRKSFAAIKSAQETMQEIQKLADEAAHKPMTACTNAKKIVELATKWNKDFQDCDPSWQANAKQTATPAPSRRNAVQLGAFVQA